MKIYLLSPIILATLAATAASGAANDTAILPNISLQSVDGAGRNIMRTTDGGIVAAFAAGNTANQLVFSRSLDNGQKWNSVVIEEIPGVVRQAAVDSNFQGSYIAFTEERGGLTVGRIAFSTAPFAATPSFVASGAVTPRGVEPRDTFIQASRLGWGDRDDQNSETVVYGWQDQKSKSLYIGVSPDGRTFPLAKKVVEDSNAVSGPGGRDSRQLRRRDIPYHRSKDCTCRRAERNAGRAGLSGLDRVSRWWGYVVGAEAPLRQNFRRLPQYHGLGCLRNCHRHPACGWHRATQLADSELGLQQARLRVEHRGQVAEFGRPGRPLGCAAGQGRRDRRSCRLP